MLRRFQSAESCRGKSILPFDVGKRREKKPTSESSPSHIPAPRLLNSGPCCTCLQILQGPCALSLPERPPEAAPEALKRHLPCGLWDWLCKKGNWIQILFRQSKWILQGYLGISGPPVFDHEREVARMIGKEAQGPQNIRFYMDCPTLLLLAHVPPKY